MIIMNDYLRYFVYTFLFTITLFIFGITLIKKRKYGQYVRKLGPKSHFGKEGTPIFGGIIIVLGALFGFVFYCSENDIFDFRYLLLLFLPIFLYVLIGFIDDFLKVKFHNNDGLSIKLKLFLQVIFSIVYYLLSLEYLTTDVVFLKYRINFGHFYPLLILLMFVSSTNAFNFCDGMDGLASGIGIIMLSSLLLISLNEEKRDLSILIIVYIGAILAFICYNYRPAKIFMGDSGSMAIGALICNLCILLKIEFLLLIIGGVMIIETSSIIIQVFYFKITRGRRLFLMAPIHHHFELKGYKENNIVYFFWLLELIFVVIGYIVYLKYY